MRIRPVYSDFIMNKRFKTKVDWWLAVLLCISPITSLFVLLKLYLDGDPNAWLGWFGVIIIAAVYTGLLFPFYYEMEEESLLIRFGCIRSRIPYSSIKKVVPTRDPISSPALSLDRLHIDTGDTLGTNISPADKSSFLKDLAGQVNHLVLADGQLLPKEES